MNILSEIFRINAFLATHPLTRRRRLSAAGACPAMADHKPYSRRGDRGLDRGTRLAARRGMTGVTGNVYAGLHEFADMAFVPPFFCGLVISSRMSVLMSAAYTILSSGVVRCRTVAFETRPTDSS